ncbi:MAG TPA: acetate kinase, partial [Methylophilaceae bacterium]|nr:acetate kinase [Methylophilaceae bacterium]
MAELTLLTINCGSSSLKASLFQAGGERMRFHYKHIDSNHAQNYANAFKALLQDLGDIQPDIIGHRFVHG